MARIVLNLKDVTGSSKVSGHEGRLDALSVREVIEVGAGGGARHSDIEVIRLKDKASPKLSVACAAGTKIEEGTIYFLQSGDSPLSYMEIYLSEVYVSRIEHETEDDAGGVYLPHVVAGSAVSVSSSLGAASLFQPGKGGALLSTNPSVRPAVAGTKGSPRNTEVERLWLSAARVRWTYKRDGNNVEKGWNIQQDIAF